jgi:Rad3-related DNA helicase/DNA polymerase III epsilon subunit-like protein
VDDRFSRAAVIDSDLRTGAARGELSRGVSSGRSHPDHLVAFDLETTGLSPRSDRILEIGAVRYDEALRPIDELQVLVDPQIPIPLAIQRLVGLTDDDVSGSPPPSEAAAQLADFCGDAGLIAHGGTFDLLFLRALLSESFGSRLIFDTLDLARILLPTYESHSLPLLSRRLGITHVRPHRALSDAQATGDLFRVLVGAGRALSEETLAEMRRVAHQAPGPVATFLTEMLARPGIDAMAPVNRATGPVVALGSVSSEFAATIAARGVGEAAAALLGPEGPLAEREGYEYRDAQVQMAVAVGQTLERKRRLMVEAGTGVGKSLAYLTPLVLWAARTGKRAVVATHTVNLQEQLADRDLPTVAGLIDVPLSVAVLKGRNHYLSLRRWQRFLAAPDVNGHDVDVAAIRFKLKMLAWLATSQTGDRSEVYLAGEEEQFWRRIASDVTDCLGPACANWPNARCHMVAARRHAADAAIVVTNHALLLAGSERQGQVLGPYDALVIDEAHHLEAVATEQLGVTVRVADLTLILDRLPAAPGTDLAIDLERCREAGQRLFGDAKGFMSAKLGGEHAANGRVGLSEAIRADAAFGFVERSAMHAAGVFQRTAGALAAGLGGAIQTDLLPQPDRAVDEVEHASMALAGLAAAIDNVVVRPRSGMVTWIEMRGEQAELHEAPVDVSIPLAESVFDPAEAVILTSATLSVGGGFDFIRHRIGIGPKAEELTLASPFDYLRQAICILPEDATAYDDPTHDLRMTALIDGIAGRLDGHTLVLFTSYGPLKRIWALLQERLDARGIASLAQGLDGTRRQILQSFLADPRCVLLATSSFWEGVDIPGDRLRCVVIDKLPFPVPTDPLVRARSERLRDPFGEYILPVAIIRLRQGFGRLIRSASDRGAVVLCDPRLRTRQYGVGFLQALPPAPRAVTALDRVPAMVDEFVNSGVLPETVGESVEWSSNDLEPA